MQKGPVIAVVGAGFTGTLTALHLLRAGPPGARILLVEKAPGFGRGLAYGTQNPSHLLNVRVGNMSAFPDDPDHLKRWIGGRGAGQDPGEAAFITRGAYGDYLAALIQAAISQPDGAERLVLVPDRATDLELGAVGGILHLAMGRAIPVDAVVLAAGNLPPLSPPGLGLEDLGPSLYAPNPWASDALADIEPNDPVLLMGAGLSMVDIALELVSRGHEGPILALSRRGLVPHRHETAPPAALAPPSARREPISARLRERRRRAAEVGWRAAVDELRPVTAELWRSASCEQRKRFLRHLRPWWDIHRHRMAPAVAAAIEDLRSRRKLLVYAGHLAETRAEDDRVVVRWRPRGTQESWTMRVARIVNCTGAGGDLARATDPLLQSLRAKGAIRRDPLGLGLDVNAACQVIDAQGVANPWLYAAGPITQGFSWEVVAVPDIRNQVVGLAQTLVQQRWPVQSLAQTAAPLKMMSDR